jgi:DNA-binding MarR family transcriptional regulator
VDTRNLSDYLETARRIQDGFGITGSQLEILLYLGNEKSERDISEGDIRMSLNMSKSTTSLSISGLVEKELAVKNRRAKLRDVYVSLTVKGYGNLQ